MSNGIINLQADHYFIECASAINEIMQPLHPFGVHFFSYIKNFPDQTQIYLSNIAQWIVDYYALQLYTTSLFEKPCANYSTGNILWPVDNHSGVYLHGKNYYNSDYGITFIEKSENYCEFYFFSSANKSKVNIINFYHHHVDIFERFIIYFKDRAEKITKKAEKAKIKIPRSEKMIDTEHIHLLHQYDEKQKKIFIEATKIYHHVFQSGELKGIRLSSRELDCLLNVAQNLSATESAKRLNLSRRTVESYLNNVKLKLGCNKREEVIEKLNIHHLNLKKISGSIGNV